MARLLREEWENDVRVRWFIDETSGELTVERHQDVQDAVDQVAAMNSAGVRTIDGLGRPVAEIPVVILQEYAAVRGIPWERLAYSPEYTDEFLRVCKAHERLCYTPEKSLFAVSA